MGKKRRPSKNFNPTTKKKPKSVPIDFNNEKQKPGWRFSTIDLDAPFGDEDRKKDEYLSQIFERIKNRILKYERLTWTEIKKVKSNHPMPVENIIPKAQKRLQELKLEDFDLLIQLQINGIERLWGIQERNILNILWWDPYHQVYPVEKRNT